MADKSRDLYRGLLIPDGDLSRVWDAETTVNEAGNRAGIPATGSKTETVLEASGHQDDQGPGRVLEVLSLRGGYPGPGEAGFGWRQAGEGVQDWRGWDVPAVISSWENVDFNSNTEFNLHPDLVNVTRTDGTDYMITVYEFVSGSNSRVAMRKRTGDVWGAETIIHVEAGYVSGRYKHPTILVLPTGRLLVFYWVYDHVNSIAQIQMKYSDDEGTTWVVGADYTLPDPINLFQQLPLRIRCAYKDGQISLLSWVKDTTTAAPDLIVQYASDDFGTSFLLVLTMTGVDTANSGAVPDVVASGGVFLVTWLRGDDLRPAINRLGNAYQPISPLTFSLPQVVDPWGTIGAGGVDGELSIAADRDGVIYLFGTQEPTFQGICCVLRSYDGGENWNSMGVGGGASSTYGRWWGANAPNSGNPAIQPVDYTVEFHRGRAVVVHRYLSTAGEEPTPGQNSLCFFYLGGFSSVVLPGLELFKRDVRRVGLPCTWVPFSLPGDSFWTRSAIGAGITEQIVSPGVLEVIVPVGSRLHYIEDPAEGSGNNQVLWEDGFIGRAACEVKDTPSRCQINNRIWTANGGGVYAELRIFIYDDRIEVVDGVSNVVYNTTPNNVDRKRQIFWAIRGLIDGETPNGAECAVWVRDWNTNEDRYWELLYQGPLTLTAGGSTSFIHWGDREVLTPSNTHWWEMNVCFGKQTIGDQFPFVGYQLAQGQANPDDLFPRNYSSSPLYVDSDTRIAAIDGPTFEADQWEITTRHLQGTENVFASVSPSPAKSWRSKTATNGDTIAFQRNPDAEDAWPGNGLYAIHFENVNFKRALLELKTGGAWVPVADIEFYKTFNFQRNGHTVRPLSDNFGSFYAYYNEFQGLKFEFNPDGEASKIATILRNTEGMAYEGTNAKPTTIFLDPETFDHTTAPTSGTAHLWFSTMTYYLDLGNFAFEGIRLQLCDTGTLPPEGYFEAGNIIPGPVAVFGWDYSRERNLTKTPNVELTTLRDGTRHAYKAGDERRRVRFSWAEGLDVTQLRREYILPDSPDYVKASAVGEPVALRQDGSLLMWGLLDRIDGPGLPVVYLPRIEFTEDGGPVFDPRQNSRGAIYGRTVSPITLETVVGTEETSEVFRVNTITIEEEI